MHIQALLAEVPFYRLPRATRRDAHFLVVIAGRSTRCERIIEPEVVAGGDFIREVRECCGALIRRDHEIRIIAIAPYDTGWCHDLAVHDIVRDIEKTRDKRLVTLDTIGENRVAVAMRRPLREKSALRPGRHNDRVLHDLRLHQAKDFGTEVLATVRPSQPAPRNVAGTQVYAFNFGRVHKNLELRFRQRYLAELRGIEFDRDVWLRLTIFAGQEIVASERCVNGTRERCQDSVFVYIFGFFDGTLDDWQQRFELASALRRCEFGVELQFELLHQQARKFCMTDEHVFHIRLAEWNAQLLQIFCVAAQQRCLAPIQSRAENKPIQAVVFDSTGEHLTEAVFKACCYFCHLKFDTALMTQVKILNPERLASLQVQLIRSFRVDVDTHILEQRQRLGKGKRFVDAVNREIHVAGQAAFAFVQVDRPGALVRHHFFNAFDVAAGLSRADVALVAERKHIAILAKQLGPVLDAERFIQLIAQFVSPGDDDVGDRLFNFLNADMRTSAGRRAYDDMHAGECGIRYLYA